MRQLAVLLIRLYQWTVSPLLGPVCRFHPSCSHYAVEALSASVFSRAALAVSASLAATPFILAASIRCPRAVGFPRPRRHHE